MEKLLLVLVLALNFSLLSNAQPWLEKLPQKKSQGNYSLFDHKNAFDEYWKPFNVNRNGKFIKDGIEVKAAGWKQFNRWYYNMEGQVNPETGLLPEKTAQQIYTESVKNESISKGSLNDSWTSVGPSSSNGGYAGVGRINCIAFHPSDNNTYWVGAPAGGLWKTSDNGSSWTCLTDDNAVLGVSDIIIPSDFATSKTIYIATGDRDAFDNYSVGVLKSTDDGVTWETTGISYTLADGGMVNRLLLDPENDDVIIAATSNGVYKTINGGTDWNTYLTGNNFIDMEFKPGDFSTLYGSTKNGDIYTSTNGGTSWVNSFSNSNAYRIELAVTPANSACVYAIAADYSDGLYGIYKSINSGDSFSEEYSGTSSNLLGWYSDASDNGGQGWYDLSIAVSPTNENDVIVGGVNSHRSTDGGSNWSCSNCWTGYTGYNTGGHPVVHADKHNLTYRNNGDLFECNDGGLYLSTDGGATWVDKSNGLVNSQMYKLGVSSITSGEVITGLQDNGTKLFAEGVWSDVKGGDGMECLIDYSDDNIQYGTYVYGQISRTMNHWSSDEDIEPYAAGDGAWVTPFIINPNDPKIIYAGYADVWKTTNRGDSWNQISSISVSGKIRSMAIANSNDDFIYVAGNQNIYKTTNGGANWSEITGTLPTNTGYIKSIAVKHTDPNTIWVTLSGYNANAVFESTNGGTDWINISSGLPELPAYSIVQNMQVTDEVHLYVGTELGVYFKGGNSNWVEYNTGLPNVKIGELEIYYDSQDESNSRLRAATYGRGLWETPVVVIDIPKITSVTTSKADGHYKLGEVIQINIEYSRAVDVDISNGTPNIKLNTEPETFAVYSGSTQNGITVLPFHYTVGEGENSNLLDYTSQNDLALNGATIKEGSNNASLKLPAVGAFSADFNIVIDNNSPSTELSADKTAINVNPLSISVVFNEKVSGFTIDDVNVINGTASELQGSGDSYTVDIAAETEGLVEVLIEADKAIDAAGNSNVKSNQFSFEYDITKPVVQITTPSNSPTAIKPIPVSISFSENVVGFDINDLQVNNGKAENFSGTGMEYVVEIDPVENGEVTVDIVADVLSDVAGNGNEKAEQLSVTYELIPPIVSFSSKDSIATNQSSFPLTIEFDQKITGFELEDLVVENATVSNLTVINDGEIYTANVSALSEGEILISMPAGKVTNALGAENGEGIQYSINYDTTEPTVQVSGGYGASTNVNNIELTVKFSEIITGFTVENIEVENGSITGLSAVNENIAYNLELSPVNQGPMKVSVNAGLVSDVAGNTNAISNIYSIVYDTLQPQLNLSSKEPIVTNNKEFYVELEFNEPIKGLSWMDFVVENGTLNNFKTIVEGISYTALATIANEGSYSVYLPAESVVDDAGNGNVSSGLLEIVYDITPPKLNRFDRNVLSSNLAELVLELDEDGDVYFALLKDGAALPSEQQVIDFVVSEALYSDSIQMKTLESKSVKFESLEPDTDYVICLVTIDHLGNYSDLITANFTSFALSVTTAEMYGLNLYPNPSSGQFYVEFNNTEVIGKDLKIINASGQIIYNIEVKALKNKITLGEVVKGTYMVVISGDKGVNSYPFIID